MYRFMMRERDTLDSDNVKMEKTIADDLEQLGKKAKYLEKQFNEANSQLRDIVSVFIILLHGYHADE
jgi:prefoldin subunit 1